MNKKIFMLFIFLVFFLNTFCTASKIFSSPSYNGHRFNDFNPYFSGYYSYNDPFEEWNKTYGSYGYGCSIQQVNDNGYILTGIKNQDIFLKRIDYQGNEIWSKEFGGNRFDMGSCVQQTTDNGFVIFGTTESYGAGETDVWIIKTDSDGNMLWNKTFGGEKLDQGNSGQQTSDGGYVLIGVTKSFVPEKNDYWVIKTDENGNELWNVTVGGIGWDVGMDIQQTSDNGFILTGIKDVSLTGSHQVDVGLEKLDSNGNLQWEKTFGSATRQQDQGFSVKQTSDGGYIITGVIDADQDSFENGDLWIIKTDNNGNKQWGKVFRGPGSDIGMSVWQTNDNGYIISGMTDSYGAGEYDLLLLRIDEVGNQLWEVTFGGDKDDIIFFGPRSVQQTSDNGYIVIGSTESFNQDLIMGPDIWVVKIKPFENICPNKPVSTYDKNSKQLTVSSTDIDGDRIKYGVSWKNNKLIDFWTDLYDSGEEVKIDCTGKLGPVGVIAKDEYGGESDWISAKYKVRALNYRYMELGFLFKLLRQWILK